MSVNSFAAKATLQVGEESYQIFRLDAAAFTQGFRSLRQHSWRREAAPWRGLAPT